MLDIRKLVSLIRYVLKKYFLKVILISIVKNKVRIDKGKYKE